MGSHISPAKGNTHEIISLLLYKAYIHIILKIINHIKRR